MQFFYIFNSYLQRLNLGSVLSVFFCHYCSILIAISVFSQKVGGGQKKSKLQKVLFFGVSVLTHPPTRSPTHPPTYLSTYLPTVDSELYNVRKHAVGTWVQALPKLYFFPSHVPPTFFPFGLDTFVCIAQRVS